MIISYKAHQYGGDCRIRVQFSSSDSAHCQGTAILVPPTSSLVSNYARTKYEDLGKDACIAVVADVPPSESAPEIEFVFEDASQFMMAADDGSHTMRGTVLLLRGKLRSEGPLPVLSVFDIAITRRELGNPDYGCTGPVVVLPMRRKKRARMEAKSPIAVVPSLQLREPEVHQDMFDDTLVTLPKRAR